MVKSENLWKTKSMLPANRKDHQLGINFSCIQQKLYFRNYQIKSYYFSKIFMSKAELHSVIGCPKLLPSLCSASLMRGLILMVSLCPQKGALHPHLNFPIKEDNKETRRKRRKQYKKWNFFSRNHADFCLFLCQSSIT